MRTYLGLLTNAVRRALRSKHDLMLENLALRQQLAVLTRQRAHTRTKPADRLFWSWLSRYWPGWRSTLVMVQPETVIRWHRTAWRGYWTWKSRARHPGRPPISKERQGLIARSATENPRWGAVRIPGRATRARLRGERGDGEVLSAEGAAPSAVPVLANLPRQPPPAALGCGLLHRPHAHLQDAVRLLLHHARAPPHRAFQRDSTSDSAMGVASVAGGDAVGAAAPLSDPGPRPLVRRCLHLQGASDRDQDDPHSRAGTEGERHRGACGRNAQARMSRPSDHRECLRFAGGPEGGPVHRHPDKSNSSTQLRRRTSTRYPGSSTSRQILLASTRPAPIRR